MNKSVSLIVIIAVACVSCQQLDEQMSCQIALNNFFTNAQRIIPQSLTSLPSGAEIDNYVIAYCQNLTGEQLAEVVISVASGKNDFCLDAVQKYAETSQTRGLNFDCVRFPLEIWKEMHPILSIISNGIPIGRLLKRTREGYELYQRGIFERFKAIAESCAY